MRRKVGQIFLLLFSSSDFHHSLISPVPLNYLANGSPCCWDGKSSNGNFSCSLSLLPPVPSLSPFFSLFPSVFSLSQRPLHSSLSLIHMPHHSLCCIASTFRFLYSLSPCMHPMATAHHRLSPSLTCNPHDSPCLYCSSSIFIL